MKFLPIYLLLLSPYLKADICEFVAPGVPDLFISNLQVVQDNLKHQILTREMNPARNVKFLDITSNFTSLIGSAPYFAKLYYSTEDHSQIRLRDTVVASMNYEKEKKLEYAEFFNKYETQEFLPPKGLNLIDGLGVRINLTSSKGFNIDKGGSLTLTVNLPFHDEIKMRIIIRPNEKGVLKNYIVMKDGKTMKPFDKIHIEAANGLFGKPSITSGIKQVKFLSSENLVYTIK